MQISYMKTGSFLALSLAMISGIASSAGFKPAPPVNNLGYVIVDPYGNAPLTALIGIQNKPVTDVRVTVRGKGEKGVEIQYPVSQSALYTYDGIPVFGLYQRHDNKVIIEYSLNGKTFKDEYTVKTGSIINKYMDSRSLSEMQQVKPVKVEKGFEKRLYMINSHSVSHQGADLMWAMQKAPQANLGSANPAGGSLAFDTVPMLYIIDTQGEYRWWLSQDAIYDGFKVDIDRRGYLFGLNQNTKGGFTALHGQNWLEMDMLGQVRKKIKLPRGYLDGSHETRNTTKGTVLLRVAKRNYVRDDKQVVHTIRDHIIEVDQSGNVVDTWDLNTILDPLRDSLLKALDAGAVCVNVDIENAGKQAKIEPEAPFGDAAGVGPGRNWAHVNSIEYDPKDDSIILSLRHQGIVKIGRNKEVVWILSPRAGWNEKLAKKVLKPVDSKGKALTCSDNGACENSDFDFSYTQHAVWLSSKGTLTSFDNGDGRHYEQPAMSNMKYSRFVEYKIDDKNLTVQQTWDYGKERGYDWYSPITSNVEYEADHDTMFGFGGSIDLFKPGKATVGKINEIDYKTREVKVEIDVLSDKPNMPHYRALLIKPETLFKF